MNRRKGKFVLIYGIVILAVFAIATHNEEPGTAMVIDLWFALPMILAYFVELTLIRKKSRAICIGTAFANTVVLFVVMCLIGAFLLCKYMYIPC